MGWARRRDRDCDRAEEEKCRERPRQLGFCCHHAGQESGQGYHPGALHDQDAREAGDEGGQARGLRQGGVRGGQARQDSRQGLLRGGLEEERLSPASSVTPQGLVWAQVRESFFSGALLPAVARAALFVRRGSCTEWVSGPWHDQLAMPRLAGDLLVWHWAARLGH